jgi:hypothetical protein
MCHLFPVAATKDYNDTQNEVPCALYYMNTNYLPLSLLGQMGKTFVVSPVNPATIRALLGEIGISWIAKQD